MLFLKEKIGKIAEGRGVQDPFYDF